MKVLKDYSNIFVRYDLVTESEEKTTTVTAKNKELQKVLDCVVKGDTLAVDAAVNDALKSNDPMDVIKEGLVKGMTEVSRLWAEGIYYLPQTMISSDAMLRGIDICEKKMGKAMDKKGKVITHTAEGDIHDLGQKIANALLRANGFEVIDLGKDVPVDDVVNAVKKHKPAMLTGTALMTTTMTAFQRISKRLIHEGIEIPFVCGGGAVSEEWVTTFDLGIHGKDASQAPAMAADAVLGTNWKEIRQKFNG
jgi:methanol corrinoid protein